MKKKILIPMLFLLLVLPMIEASVTPPTGIIEYNVTNSSFMIRWDAVINASSYNVQISRNPGFGTYISNNNTASPMFTFTHLQSSTTYYYRINASNSTTSNFTQDQVATLTNAGDTGLFLGGILSMNFEKISNIIFFFFLMILALVFYVLDWAIISAFIVLMSGIIIIFSGIHFLIGLVMFILAVVLIFKGFQTIGQ